MLAFSRHLALALVACAALLPAYGILTATPANATACPTISYSGGPTLTNCSETFTITGTPGAYSVTAAYNISNGSTYLNSGYDVSGNVLVGVINNTGSTVYDLSLTSFSSGPAIFAFTPGETLCQTSPSVCYAGGATGMEGMTSTGQEVYFNISTSSTGDVIFGTGLAAGTTAYFGLAANAASVCVTNSSGVCVPTTASEPASIGIFLVGLLGFGMMRRRWLARRAPVRRLLLLPRRTRRAWRAWRLPAAV